MTSWQWAAYWGKVDILLQVWEWGEEKLTKEGINKLLLATDNVGITSMHQSACNGNLDVLLKVCEGPEENKQQRS